MVTLLQKRMKKLQIKDSIAHIISAHAVSVATQFIVCSVGIGDAPQQAKSQGVYHLALLATFVSRIKGHNESAIAINLNIFIFTSFNCNHLSQDVVIIFIYLA